MLSPYTIQTYKQITLQSNFRRDRSGSSHYVSRDIRTFLRNQRNRLAAQACKR